MKYGGGVFCHECIYIVRLGVICRPSDLHTVGRPPEPRFEPRPGGQESVALTTRPPHLLLDHHTFSGEVLILIQNLMALR